jgi:hypothetical protein
VYVHRRLLGDGVLSLLRFNDRIPQDFVPDFNIWTVKVRTG